MLKYSSVAAIMGVLAFGAFHSAPARASQGVQLPGGDSLDFTPPFDVTEPQVQSAPRRDRRKVRAIQRQNAAPQEQGAPFDIFGE